MKRWAIRILLCLALGVVATVGVAWGMVWLIQVDDPSQEVYQPSHAIESSGEEDWEVFREERVGTTLVSSARYAHFHNAPKSSSPAPHELVPEVGGLEHPLPQYASGEWVCEIRWVEMRGWPLRALWYDAGSVIELRGTGWVPRGLAGGIELPKPSGPLSNISEYRRALPFRPILPGLIINTLFYAALWFALFTGIGAAKRAHRRRRGRCPMCAYDLRGHVGGVRGEPPPIRPESGPHPGPLHEGEGARVVCPECAWNRDRGENG